MVKSTSRVRVRRILVPGTKIYAQGIEASWEPGEWVAIICNKGMIGCGAFDVGVMNEFQEVVAIARGAVENPLITCEDLLQAKITDATESARTIGIREGMTASDAVRLLS